MIGEEGVRGVDSRLEQHRKVTRKVSTPIPSIDKSTYSILSNQCYVEVLSNCSCR